MATSQSTVQFRGLSSIGYPGYKVGDDGSVWFRWVNCRWGRRPGKRWKPMKIGVHKRGYCIVNITPFEGRGYKTFRVHRLVLTAFVGPCPEGMECRHLNGNKTDNRLENLCWGTQEENRQDTRDHGTYKKGENHHRAKLTNEQVKEIRRRYDAGGVSQKELADEFGAGQGTVHNIVRRKGWPGIEP